MEAEQLNLLLAELHSDWSISECSRMITRKIKTKNFSESLSIVNSIGELSEQKNHHPDISMGWGYCNLSYTTHSHKQLTELDFICAKHADSLISELME